MLKHIADVVYPCAFIYISFLSRCDWSRIHCVIHSCVYKQNVNEFRDISIEIYAQNGKFQIFKNCTTRPRQRGNHWIKKETYRVSCHSAIIHNLYFLTCCSAVTELSLMLSLFFYFTFAVVCEKPLLCAST